ncbi:MAG: gfo/Idh/MocA family oxidoreductase [Chitinophagaceae bacterium]|nr:gfo/Idh/MocA family oxidoreductase [Chitinophagaceae bacterium]NCW87358.1 gfo/Idh/MocA family oxidoreductase [Chitinophagia bacterium]NDB52868.1 gfo/Idh/MocA family oxidoreductase [Chitinophagaceae bacterium]NDE78141.1 gfo/Idh/MocA family oxidoreductase [Chitinophagaceae bacterium]
MSTPRRNFIRTMAVGSSVLASGLPLFAQAPTEEEIERSNQYAAQKPVFNMCGYAAPKLEVVRIGIIGIGMRGSDAVGRLSYIDGVEIVAICDKYPERLAGAQKTLASLNRPKAKEYSGEEGWKALCESNDVDLIYTCTPWPLHTPIAVYAMNHGKHAATEVPAALTLDQCWQLVETSERTRKHCMMLENCCYDFFELLTLNMIRQGLFGEIVHAEGAYIHDLSIDWLFNKKAYADMWRIKENIGKSGSLYPTHGLGPVAQCMNINRGDLMEHLVSMSTADFSLAPLAKEMAQKDPFFEPYVGKSYRGNMNNTIIRTVKGKTILIQHDVSTPRPYSRIHLVSGTKGVAQKWPSPARVAFGHSWIKEDQLKTLEEKYTLPIVKHIGSIAKEVGGHGGMDFIMDWRLIDCLRNGLPLDQDVYDAASWSSIVPLSIQSTEKRSRTVDIPDFTRGNWKQNNPVNLTLEGGGTTGVRSNKPALKM